MIPIWLDTDIGSDVDDAVALLCALRHPDIRLVGISTVLHRVEINTWLAREMVTRAGAGGIPVLPGAMARLGAEYEQKGDWMPSHGRLAPSDLPRLSPVQDADRVATVAEAMMAMAQPFHLLTIGPLTNIGHLLTRHADVTAKWSAVTCMGGWIESEPEYNVHCDVTAAQMVLQRLNPRMVGLEASSYTLTREEAEAALDPSDPASAFLLDCYREYRSQADWLPSPDQAPLTLFDAITLLSLVRPQAFDFQEVRALVESDGRMRLTDDGAPVTYAMSCDWDAVKPLITELLWKGQAA